MAARRHRLYVAASHDDDSGGIVVFVVAPSSGSLRRVGEWWGTPALRALALHPSGRAVYGVGGAESGAVVALAVSQNALCPLSVEASAGAHPCSVTVDPTGQYLMSANYVSAELALHRLGADGRIGPLCAVVHHEGAGPDPDRQDAAHLHQVIFDPHGTNILVTDLGGDAIYAYRLDVKAGTLRAAPVACSSAPPGAGPRHLAFHPDGHVIVADELSATVSLYRYSRRTGALTWHSRVAASQSADPEAVRNYPSEVAVAPDTGLVFVANRGPDTIGIFSVGADGLASVAEIAAGTSWPQHLVVTGTRLYCAGQHGGTITMLSAGDQRAAWSIGPVATLPGPTWILADDHPTRRRDEA